MTHDTDDQSAQDFLMGTKRPAESEDAKIDRLLAKIHQRHMEKISLAGISPVVAAGTVATQNGSLLFNYRRPDGSRFTVERPDAPGDGPKYRHPPGGRGLNVHPLVSPHQGDVSAPLLIVEGTKQYLAVVSAALGKKIFAVGISGIRNWQWKPGGEGSPSVPLPDWSWIPLRGRKVYVIPDGDYATNDAVRAGADDLMDLVRALGASEVHRVTVPLSGDAHTGIDDHLGALEAQDRQRELLRLVEEAEDDSDEIFLTRDDLDSLPAVEPLIKGMLNKASIVWLSGKFGTYKTFLALAWSCCVATGRPWEGKEVSAPGPVVYVAAEGQHGLSGRLRTWEGRYNRGQKVADIIPTRKGLDPRDPKAIGKIIRQVQRSGAVMVVFDTLHRCAPGLDENMAKEQGDVIGGLQKIVNDTGATVLVLHHTGHDGTRARGSSSQEDDADDAYVIKFAGDPEDRSPSNQRVLVRRKSKEGEAGEEFGLRLVSTPGPDPFNPSEGSTAYVTLQRDGADPEEGEPVGSPRPENNVQRIMREMDEAGMPVDLSVNGARGWLAARGVEIRGRNTDWLAALSARKQRG